MATNTKNGVSKHEDMAEAPGNLRSLLGGKDGGVRSSRKLVEPLRDEYPLVAEILGGLEASGKEPEVPGGTITFSIREGKIRFTANVKSAKKTFYGDVADIANPWGSVNSAFLTNQVAEREYTERTASLTEEQKSLLL